MDYKKWDRVLKYAALCLAGCFILAVLFQPSGYKDSFGRIQSNAAHLTTSLNRYYSINKEYPASLKEFENFLAKEDRPTLENEFIPAPKTGYGQAYVDLKDLLPSLKWKSNTIYLKSCQGRILYQPFLNQQAFRLLYCIKRNGSM